MIRRNALAHYLDELQQKGRIDFTAKDAERTLGIGHRSFLDAAERLQRTGKLLAPRHGYYVIVPPMYRAFGTPPLTWYIDSMMKLGGDPYYVGLLTAAEFHGASHHAVMRFQIMSSTRLAPINLGRNRADFYFRKTLPSQPCAIDKLDTETGTLQISSPAQTALDLIRYPRPAGGIDHTATVLVDLAEAIDPVQLFTLSKTAERTVVQRLGFLMDWLGEDRLADPLLDTLRNSGSYRWTSLRAENYDPSLCDAPNHRDAKWRISTRRLPDPDL